MNTPSRAEPQPACPSRRRDAALVLALLAAIILAYLPALRGDFVLDDNVNVTAPELRSVDGLGQIWGRLGATQQYYPFLYTVFWVEHRLWGGAAFGYHLANVLQHAAVALLLVAVVRRLKLPGAWFAGFVFALHPVNVESVAWVSEQKNTLSTALCLGAALTYLMFDQHRRRWQYAGAFGHFLLARMTKTVTATLPAALLVVLWWRRGRLEWRRDAWPLAPWLVLGVGAGLFSAWVERRYVGAVGDDFALPFLMRCLVAVRAVWFYLGKLAWPADLVFMYPRWSPAAESARGYVALVGVALAAGLLVHAARRRRGPLAAFLLFVGLLFPTLGFFNVYWFVASYVADHFVYLPGIALIVAFAAAATLAARKAPAALRRAAPVFGIVLLTTLGVLTWRHAGWFGDFETLCRRTLARNPGAWMMHDDLGFLLTERAGGMPEAIEHFRAAIRLEPDYPDAHLNLALALLHSPEGAAEGIAELQTAARLKPRDAETQFYLGGALANSGRMSEAVRCFQQAVELKPGYADAEYLLANALGDDPAQAPLVIQHLEAAVRANPDHGDAHLMLGQVLARIPGRMPDAIVHFAAARRLKPELIDAYFALGTALGGEGRWKEALPVFEDAVRLAPGLMEAHYNLGCVLAKFPGRRDDARAQFRIASELRPDFAPAAQMLKQLSTETR